METIVEEQIQKENMYEKINQALSNGNSFMSLLGRKDEAQSISQFDQQRFIGCSSIDQLTLKNNDNEPSSSSYLEVKRNQLFKKYSGRTPKMIHYKFSIDSNNLMQKTQSLKNQVQVDGEISNKPRSQEQIDKGLIRKRSISRQILRSQFSNLYELTLQNQKNNPRLQQQKLPSVTKSHTSRNVKIDDFRKLQNILFQKQKKLFLKTNEDKSNIIKNQIKQRQLIVRTVTYILFIIVFFCMKIILDNYF